jgi:protein-disulfide isomerase
VGKHASGRLSILAWAAAILLGVLIAAQPRLPLEKDDRLTRSAEVIAVDVAPILPSVGLVTQAPRLEPFLSTSTAELGLRAANRIGPTDAPVTIIEFADFQCPYCAEFFQDVEPLLRQDYVSANKVAIVFKHLAILGPESVWAAQAAECAADQGRFWDYHDLLYADRTGEEGILFDRGQLINLAWKLQLDSSQFEHCLGNDETLARVQADRIEARQIGVRSTPAFLINGQLLIGAWPYEAFQSVIEAELQKDER